MAAKVIAVFPYSNTEKFVKEWSQHSPDNVWRRENGGNQVYYDDGITPRGDRLVYLDIFDFKYKPSPLKNNENIWPNEKFPENLIHNVKELLDTEDAVFVIDDRDVRKALQENGIMYTHVYPEKSALHAWEYRMCTKLKSKDMFYMFSTCWDAMIAERDAETYPEKYRLDGNHDEICCTVVDDILYPEGMSEYIDEVEE